MQSNWRHKVEEGFEALGHRIFRNKYKTLLLVLLFAFALISQLPKTTIDTSTEGFLHEKDPTLIAYNDFRDQFGRDERLLLVITAPDLFDKGFLEKLQKLHKRLENEVPHLNDITSLVNARNTRGEGDRLIVEDLLEHWPKTDEELAEVKARAMDNVFYKNLLLSENGTTTAVILESNTYAGQGAKEDVLAGFDDMEVTGDDQPKTYLTDKENSEFVNAASAIADEFRDDGFRIQITGSPAITNTLKGTMQRDMRKFVLMVVATIAVLLFLLFRRLSGVFLPLITVILALLATLGLMAATGTPIKLPTQILPSFLLSVIVGATVHLLAIFYKDLNENKDRENAIAFALGHSGLAIVMTSLTTAAGLGSFAFAEVAPIGDLGIFAAAGVLIGLVFTLVLLPALLAIFPVKPNKHGGHDAEGPLMDRILTGIADFAVDRPKTVVAVSAVLAAVALVSVSKVTFSHFPLQWFPKDHTIRIATETVDHEMKGTVSIEMILDTGRENGLYDPKVLQAMDDLQRELEATVKNDRYFVGKTVALPDILKETNRALHANDQSHYTIPENRELVAQELFLFENSGSDDLEDMVDSRFSKARFTIKVPYVDSFVYNEMLDEVAAKANAALGDAGTVRLTGMVPLLTRTFAAAMESTKESYVIAAIAITLMMILLVGSVRLGIVAMIPNFTPILLAMGLIVPLGLFLDMFTMLTGAIAIGLAVDDTVHFMHNFRRYFHMYGDVRTAVRKTLTTTGRAMIVTTVVLSVGFFVYLFSEMNNLFGFGVLTGTAILFALAADFLLAPALMALMHRKTLKEITQ